MTNANAQKIRVMHFVTGGFSGATQVAISLSLAALKQGNIEIMLVLRRKKNTGQEKIDQLRAQGLNVQTVSNWMHILTVWQLRKIMRSFRPDVFFAHGFSDHIWGRQAAVDEKVPKIFHIEHNSRERYTKKRIAQTKALMPHTHACIGVSEGVRKSLIALGLEPNKCKTIQNGIDVTRFPDVILKPWSERQPAILMTARFSRQKDHKTLINALTILKEKNITPKLFLAGEGKKNIKTRIQKQVSQNNLCKQVYFLGNVANLPELLGSIRIFVLATHWEGMPIALVEAMMAGCACIGSDVAGPQELITHNITGLKVPEHNAHELSIALEKLLLDNTFSERIGQAARQHALQYFSQEQMWTKYSQLIQQNQ